MPTLPRILLVDDEERFRTNLQKMLAAQGFEVTAVDSGERALEEMARQLYDVVLLDMRMPAMSGLEALAAMKKSHPDAEVIMLTGHASVDTAREIIRLGIEAFRRRDPQKVNIPDHQSVALAGFSTEAIVGALSKVDKEDPLKPLIDNIVAGNISGVCLFAGCNNVRITQDENYLVMAKELARENVLLLATGCGAGAFARHGLLTSEATNQYAGDGLKAVFTAVGQAAGLNAPLPLVLHMGSCVDNARAVQLAVAVANRLGVDVDKLPVVASAPEATTEKAVSIGTYAVAAGLPTHLGVIPPVLGSPLVAQVLTQDIKNLFGGYFIVEPDPVTASQKLLGAIRERRAGLGL